MLRFSVVLVLFFIISFVGCRSIPFEDSLSVSLNKEYTVPFGSSLFTVTVREPDAIGFQNPLRVPEYMQTFSYVGKSGSTIKICYREYLYNSGSWLIRDKFTQTLEYDLSDGNLLAYQNFKFRVIQADSKEITFILLSR